MEKMSKMQDNGRRDICEITYDATSCNGLMIGNKGIPDEILSKIFCYADPESLLLFQLVCKHWYYLIRNYVWHKKAEQAIQKPLPMFKKEHWAVYYFICDNRPFYRNLMKNHSGERGLFKNWSITENGGDGWGIECPPKTSKPLPKDSVFEGKNHCFVTSYSRCYKEQVINLIDEGFSEFLLDWYQPTIRVSEWFCSHPDIPAVYECSIKLLRDQKSDRIAMESLSYQKVIESDQMNQWFKFEHVFKSYGKGLRKIKFFHGGRDRSYVVNGHYGSKMAGACIQLEIHNL